MATIGSLVCTPRRGAVSIETMLCLREHLNGYPNRLLTAFRRPIRISSARGRASLVR